MERSKEKSCGGEKGYCQCSSDGYMFPDVLYWLRARKDLGGVSWRGKGSFGKNGTTSQKTFRYVSNHSHMEN